MSIRYRWSLLWTVFFSLPSAAAAQQPDSVEIHPAATSVDVAPYSTNTQRFWVVNTGTQSNQYGVFANVCTPYDLYCDWSNTFLGTIASNDSVPVDVKFTAGAAGTSGTISFEARINTNQSIRATRAFTVTARQETHLEVAALNPGSVEDRDLCLTVSVATDAAYECGDLRLVHALPSVRARGKVRTPTLLYNSRFAHPFGLVAATFSTPPHDLTNVTATLRVPQSGGDIVVSQGFSDALFTASHVEKFVLAFDASALPTGVYPYTVTTRFSLAGTPDSVTASGELLVVNWKTSPFGAGWWLAGYERLYAQTDGSLLWVGGDGSARHYASVGSGVYRAPSIDRPDSITTDSSGNFVRHLRSGASVEFAPNGKHFATTDRLGLVTFFHHDGYGQMAHIDPAGISALQYDLTYSSFTGPLETVRAPSVDGVARVVQRYVLVDGRILQHTDPDGTTIQFGFGNASMPEQITSRLNRRSITQSFAFDAVGKLVTVRAPLNASDTAVTTFCPAESRGYVSTSCSSGPLHPDSAVTVMDGPRTDTTVTTFRLDRFGAPKLITDALGNETQVFRGNRNFPGLVTRLVHANGWVNDAFHDTTGLVTKLVQYAPLGPNRDAVTEYAWDPKWERVTQIVFPEGNLLQFAYDDTTGNRLYQQDGRGSASRVDFTYHGTGAGAARLLLASTVYPADPTNVRARDTVLYDSLGNVSQERRATGTTSEGRTSYERDSIGRVLAARTLIDTTSAEQIDSTTYDLMDRVVLTRSFGPAMSGVGAASVFAATAYDDEGNPIRVKRWSNPDPTAIDTIASASVYDLGDRAVADTAPDLRVSTRSYDLAGNVLSTTTRRGHTIAMAYDPLNRLTTRTIPSVTYADTSLGIGGIDTTSFPRRPNSGTNYVIAPDTETFTYDPLGRIATANNHDARMTRTYYANGLLETEELKVRNARDTSFSHDYVSSYGYDLNGRRIVLHAPNQLTTGTADSIAYAYNDTTGELQTIQDPLGQSYTYAYTLRGEPKSLAVPNQYEEHWSYFLNGDVQTDSILNTGATTGGRIALARLRASSFTYDRRRKRLTADDAWGYQEFNQFSYTGLGYVASSYMRQSVDALVASGGTAMKTARSGETLMYDALGNLDTAVTVDSSTINGTPNSHSRRGRVATYEANVGRLSSEASAEGPKTYVYDPAGNLELSIREEAAGPGSYPRENRFTYYGADDPVRAVDFRSAFPGDVDLQFKKWTFEEYRYDALGRRIWVQADRDCDDARTGQQNEEWLDCNLGTLRRTVWDGQQELVEIQVPYRLPGGSIQPDSILENDAYLPQLARFGSSKDPNPYFGRVLYVDGLALDQPLAVVRYNYVDFFNTATNHITFSPTSYTLFWTALGKFGPVVCGDGEAECKTTSGGRTATMGMNVPNNWFVLDRPVLDPIMPRFFQGTLVADKLDANGTLFRRNRYYDPSTGRFTQEDPIGLAGGINLYGFAAGDPVNFSDPFGLCPPAWLCEVVGAAGEWAANHPAGATALADFAENVARGTTVWTGGTCSGPGCRTGAFLGAIGIVSETARLPGNLPPDEFTVVRGGTSDVPPPGEVFSGAAGSSLEDAAAGVPHGQIRATTAGQIRSGGGSVNWNPERSRSGAMNERHVDVCLGSGSCPFGPLQQNPVPKAQRIQ